MLWEFRIRRRLDKKLLALSVEFSAGSSDPTAVQKEIV
jgi:hypothetical protein